MSTLLDVKNLGISFGGLRAVNDFDLKIQKEELYGLIDQMVPVRQPYSTS